MRSNMEGMIRDYRKMYDAISNWASAGPPTQFIDGKMYNEPGHYFYGFGWSLGDAPYHGWSGDALQNERDICKNVGQAWANLMDVLEEAIGLSEEEKVDRKFL